MANKFTRVIEERQKREEQRAAARGDEVSVPTAATQPGENLQAHSTNQTDDSNVGTSRSAAEPTVSANRSDDGKVGAAHRASEPTVGANQTDDDQPGAPGSAAMPTAGAGLREILAGQARRQAKNKTYYLDEQVIEAVSAYAQQENLPESRLVNAILKQALGL